MVLMWYPSLMLFEWYWGGLLNSLLQVSCSNLGLPLPEIIVITHLPPLKSFQQNHHEIENMLTKWYWPVFSCSNHISSIMKLIGNDFKRLMVRMWYQSSPPQNHSVKTGVNDFGWWGSVVKCLGYKIKILECNENAESAEMNWGSF